MKVKLLTIGNRAPSWVEQGFQEYARRMPRELPLVLTEIAPEKHHKDKQRFRAREGERMAQHIDARDWVVALDEHGRNLESVALAKRLSIWQEQAQDVALLVGGSDGLAPELLSRANETIALSALTLPHYLVRVVVAEALYRASSINAGHPYHRA